MPVYKGKGSLNDVINYRGITLLSCLGKLFTSIINERIRTYLNNTGMIGDEQAGFRSNHSTLDHIFTLYPIVDFYLRKKRRIYCAFIDYEKAFDLVDRTSLWSKLIGCNVNGNVLKVINTFYANAKSAVIKDGIISEYFQCNIGVRQGENLSRYYLPYL